MHAIRSTFLALSAAISVLGQGTLIDPSTRNGGFEDGVASPWLGLQVAQDAAFASQGSWFAVLQATNTPSARVLGMQAGIPAAPTGGNTFIVTFDARNGVAGFDSISVEIVAHNLNGTFVSESMTPVLAPPLSSLGWGTFQTRIQFSDTWDGGGGIIALELLFKRNLAVSGTIYTGYLDNVTLQQIPEPAAFWLLGCGGLLAWFQRRRGLRCCRPGSPFEMTGSGATGDLLDSNPTTGLVFNNFNSCFPGRYIFQFHNGSPISLP